MGTSYTELNKHGFWSNDELLAGTLFLISLELKKLNSKDNFVVEITTDIHNAATGGFVGCIPDHIRKFNSPDKSKLLRQVLVAVIERVRTDFNSIIDELNKNEVSGASNYQTEDKKGIEVTTNLLLRLIDGQLKTDSSSKIDYWSHLD